MPHQDKPQYCFLRGCVHAKDPAWTHIPPTRESRPTAHLRLVGGRG